MLRLELSGISKRGFQNRSSESVGLSFQVYSEPKNPILGTLPAEVLVAKDENGGNLVPPKDPNNNNFRSSNYYQNSYRGHNAYGNLSLVRSSKDATSIKTLKGKMGIILLAGVVPEVVIANPLKVKNKKVAGRTAEVTTCRAPGTHSTRTSAPRASCSSPSAWKRGAPAKRRVNAERLTVWTAALAR